ncbi:hypothetical protein NQ317_008296, partial [Molorchus minor]
MMAAWLGGTSNIEQNGEWNEKDAESTLSQTQVHPEGQTCRLAGRRHQRMEHPARVLAVVQEEKWSGMNRIPAALGQYSVRIPPAGRRALTSVAAATATAHPLPPSTVSVLPAKIPAGQSTLKCHLRLGEPEEDCAPSLRICLWTTLEENGARIFKRKYGKSAFVGTRYCDGFFRGRFRAYGLKNIRFHCLCDSHVLVSAPGSHCIFDNERAVMPTEKAKAQRSLLQRARGKLLSWIRHLSHQ